MPVDNFRLLFIINPISGNGSKANLERTIRDYFKELSHTLEFYELNGKDDATSIKYWIKEWKPDRVVAAGGDGTLKLVAEELAGTKIPIGILPVGSANGMARELGIPENFTTCLDIITGDQTEMIDVIRLNDRELCLHLSDFGLNAHLVKHFEESDRRGMWGYAREIFKVMSKRQQFRVEIKMGKKTVFRYAWMVVIANARMYGTGAAINPQGDLQDGLLEVIVMRKISIWEILKMLIGNRPFDPNKTEVLQGASALITTKKSVHFQVDGEYKGVMRKISASVEQHGICVLCPPLEERLK